MNELVLKKKINQAKYKYKSNYGLKFVLLLSLSLSINSQTFAATTYYEVWRNTINDPGTKRIYANNNRLSRSEIRKETSTNKLRNN